MKPLIFIDGEAGTTGLQIHERLRTRNDIELLQLPASKRKNDAKRKEALNACDIAILCLPDDAARQAVCFVDNPAVSILDASSAHRTTAGWVYGFAELTQGQERLIQTAKRVSNPGCYPTGAIALLRPLIEAGLLPPDYPVNVQAISGYSGTGRSLIDAYEDPQHPQKTSAPFRAYGLNLAHKHTPEMQLQSGLLFRPIFTPAYGKYRQGIVLTIPIHLRLLGANASAQSLHACLAAFYAGAEFMRVLPMAQASATTELDPEYLNGTNQLDMYVFSNEEHGQVLLAAVYDNLGKGASGAAVQNLNLMLNGLRR